MYRNDQSALEQFTPRKVQRKTSFTFEVVYFRPAGNTGERIVVTIPPPPSRGAWRTNSRVILCIHNVQRALKYRLWTKEGPTKDIMTQTGSLFVANWYYLPKEERYPQSMRVKKKQNFPGGICFGNKGQILTLLGVISVKPAIFFFFFSVPICALAIFRCFRAFLK